MRPAAWAEAWLGPQAAACLATRLVRGPAQAWLARASVVPAPRMPPRRRAAPGWATRANRGPSRLGPRSSRVASQARPATHAAQLGLGGEPRPAGQRGSITGLAIQARDRAAWLTGRRPAIGPCRPARPRWATRAAARAAGRPSLTRHPVAQAAACGAADARASQAWLACPGWAGHVRHGS